jgi:hypothetical protein
MPRLTLTGRKVVNLNIVQVDTITWLNAHRRGWREESFSYVGMESAAPISEALMSNRAVAQQIQELDNSIRCAADLEAMLRQNKSKGFGNKWLHELFSILKNVPRLLKEGIKNEENGLGPFADLSPDERDAQKREICEWKMRYLNYLERMEREEVEE